MPRLLIRSLVPLAAAVMIVAASTSGTESTAAGWLALAIAITALVLAIGFVMITSARGPDRPGHRGGHHPRAT